MDISSCNILVLKYSSDTSANSVYSKVIENYGIDSKKRARNNPTVRHHYTDIFLNKKAPITVITQANPPITRRLTHGFI